MKKKELTIPEWMKSRDESAEKRINQKKLTKNHINYMKMIENKIITICTGFSGTGKTFLALEVAANLFKQGKISQIVVTRPQVECGEKTGFLPGNIEEKMQYFIAPVMAGLSRHFSKNELENMKAAGKIVIVPLAQMRGITYHNAFMIIDECQNATYGQIEMFLTRIGEGTRAVINGDLKQSDITSNIEDVAFLRAIRDLIKPPKEDGIGFMIFGEEDVLRSYIVGVVTKRMGEGNYSTHDIESLFEDVSEIPSYGKNYYDYDRDKGSGDNFSRKRECKVKQKDSAIRR